MKRLVIGIAFLLSGILLAQNIIKDPEFDTGKFIDCQFNGNQGTMKAEIVTEDANWNKCLRVEKIADNVNPKTGMKSDHIVVTFGNDGKEGKNHPGFTVKPHTVYEFQFELKGNVVPIIRYMEWNGNDYWRDVVDTPKANVPKKPVVSDEWQIVKGTFRIGPKAKYAGLQLFMWGDDKWKNVNPIGSYFMVDKIQIRQQAALLPEAKADNGGIKEKQVNTPCIILGETYNGFTKLRSKEPAQADTSYSCQIKDGKVLVNIRCNEPFMDKLKASIKEDNGSVWKDDCVEIFFNSKLSGRKLNQFVVSAGGGRWMGRGNSENVSEYSSWKASVTKEKDAWIINAEIPLSLMGWNEPPKADEALRMLIGRNRTPVKETTSSTFTKDGFHDLEDWAYLFPNGAKAWGEAQKPHLLAKAKKFDKIVKEINEWKPTDKPAENLAKVNYFKDKTLAEELAGRKFVLTHNPITTDTQIPFLPETLANPPASISDRAAQNELHCMALAITNLTEQVEEYRIVLSAINEETSEKWVLENKDGKSYPPEKITMFRAIRVKDGDEASHGRRYDPLVPMDVSQTVVVPPRESAPIFVQFDTFGVQPGVYQGVVRVIPLGEEGTLAQKNPSYKDIPFSFEVLPFALQKGAIVRHMMYQEARNEEDFKIMVDAGVTVFQINSWYAWFNFADDGSVSYLNTSKMEAKIADYKKWAKKYGIEDKMEICFHYGAYWYFMNNWSKNKFKPFTPVWEKAWLNYMAGIDAARAKCDFPLEKWSIEIEDEPKAEALPEALRALELAKKAHPNLKFMLTLGAHEIPCDTLMKFVPYINEWCFWNIRFFLQEDMKPLLARLRKENKIISTYTCNTSMRSSLQSYYRHVPWTVPYFNLNSHNFYEHSSHKYRTRSWREATCGEVVIYSNGHPVTTIRNECLKSGLIDLKYLAVLKQCQEKVGKDSALGKKIGTFIEKTTYAVIMNPPEDPLHFEKIRAEMINLILEAQK